MKRHQAVANGIANLLETSSNQSILSTLCKSDARVLEIGGANFATALALKKLKPHLQITSIEPSPEQVPETNDIDIIIDRDFLGFSGELTKSKREQLRKRAGEYTVKTIFPELSSVAEVILELDVYG
mgnify:CR=1 FL=1